MLKDFSLEIYDKQELQLLGRPGNHQTQASASSSKPWKKSQIFGCYSHCNIVIKESMNETDF